MDLNKVEILPPFKNFFATVGNIPSSYQESMTYYEMLQWFCNYLENTVIPTLNNNGQSVIELQNLFTQLHDYVEKYFNDLDVQEEINNKLDIMASDGTLNELLLPYFNTYKNEINSIITNQNQTINSINNKVNSAVSGSPLVANSISEMTNTSRIYVNTTNGHWYWYNGSNWIDGGVYQSTELGNNSVDYSKLTSNSSYNFNANYSPLKNGFTKSISPIYHQGAFQPGTQEPIVQNNRVYSDLFSLSSASGMLYLIDNSYSYSLLTYDLEENYINESGWTSRFSYLDNEHKYRINIKKNNDSNITPATINSTLPIRIYEQQLSINNVNLQNTQKLDDFFTMLVGYSSSGSDLTRSADNKRITTLPQYCLKGTTIKNIMSTTSFSVLTVDDKTGVVHDTGWRTTDYTIEQNGYVVLNIRKTSNNVITDNDATFMARFILIEQNLNFDSIRHNKEQLTFDLDYPSINLEYSRAYDSSYIFARIPKTSNKGKKIRPHVLLTSRSNTISGTKQSALDYAKRAMSLFTVNAGLFNISQILPLGQLISEGEILLDEPLNDLNGWTPNSDECYPLCIDNNGNLSSNYNKAVTCAELLENNIIACVCGWGCIIKDYNINEEFFGPTGYHDMTVTNPIQIIGQYANGDYLFLSIDGNRGSIQNERGMTLQEATNILQQQNVKYAYMLDGGGSSETVLGKRQLNPIYENATGRKVPTVISFIEED